MDRYEKRSLSDENLVKYTHTDHHMDNRDVMTKRYVDNYKLNGSMARSIKMNSFSSSDNESPRKVPLIMDDGTKHFMEKIEKYKRKNKELRARLQISESEVERLRKEIKGEIHKRQELLNSKNKKPFGREKEIQTLRDEIRYLENLIVNNNKASRVQWALNQGIYTSNIHESLVKTTKDNIVLGKKVKNLLRDNARFIEWRKIYRKDNLNWERERIELLNIIDRMEIELVQKNDMIEVLKRNESRLSTDYSNSVRLMDGFNNKPSKLKYSEEEYEQVLEKLKKVEKKLRSSEEENEEILKKAKEKQKSDRLKLQEARDEIEALLKRPREIEERIIQSPPQIYEKLVGISTEAHERIVLELKSDAEKYANEINRWKKLTYELEERLRREQMSHDAEIIEIKRRFMI